MNRCNICVFFYDTFYLCVCIVYVFYVLPCPGVIAGLLVARLLRIYAMPLCVVLTNIN